MGVGVEQGGQRERDDRVDVGVEGYSNARLIGQGAFGAVYEARQHKFDRAVALKILTAPGLEDDTEARFEIECRAVGALSGHPNIVTVFDSGINSWGRPYIVMDLMSGGSLASLIATDGPLSWTRASEIGIKIAGAIATAHHAGVLHRDVKPENVLLSAYGEPKLADFGISSLVAATGGSVSGALTASLAHAAPEILNGARPSAASDVYALASTLFTCLAGRTPFVESKDEPLQAVIARILTSPVPDLRPRGVPDLLCRAIEQGLVKDPAQRYRSATAFGEAVRGAQEAHGIAPTEMLVDAEVSRAAAEGYRTAERYSPAPRTLTARTRARFRPILAAPPVPEPEHRKRWFARPAFLAALVVLLLTGAAAAAVLNVVRKAPRAPVARPSPVAAGEARAERVPARDRRDEGRGGRAKTARRSGERAGAGSGAVASGGGYDIADPAVDAPDAAPDIPGPGAADRARRPKPKAKEDLPPAPVLDLFWLRNPKTDEHYVTITAARAASLHNDGWEMRVLGEVYESPMKNTTSIKLDDGTAYIFDEPLPETDPKCDTSDLWMVTKGDDFTYTKSSADAGAYDATGWSTMQRVGFIRTG